MSKKSLKQDKKLMNTRSRGYEASSSKSKAFRFVLATTEHIVNGVPKVNIPEASTVINDENKNKLMELVEDQGKSVMKAAKILNVNYDSAREFIKQERLRIREAIKEDKIKKKIQEKIDKIKQKEIELINNYQTNTKINVETKNILIMLVKDNKISINDAAQRLCINYDTARIILDYEKKRLEKETKKLKAILLEDQIALQEGKQLESFIPQHHNTVYNQLDELITTEERNNQRNDNPTYSDINYSNKIDSGNKPNSLLPIYNQRKNMGEVMNMKTATLEGDTSLKDLVTQSNDIINSEIKMNLIKLVNEKKKSIKEAAEILSIDFIDAVHIITQIRKELEGITSVQRDEEINLEEGYGSTNFILKSNNIIINGVEDNLIKTLNEQGRPTKEIEKPLFLNYNTGKDSTSEKRKRTIEDNIQEIRMRKQDEMNMEIAELITIQMEEEIKRQIAEGIKKGNSPRKRIEIKDGTKAELIQLVSEQKMSIKAAAEQLSISYNSAKTIVFREKERIKKELNAKRSKSQTQDEIDSLKEIRLANLQRIRKRDGEVSEKLVKIVSEGKMNIREAAEHLSISYNSAQSIIRDERYRLVKIINTKKASIMDGNEVSIEEIDKLKSIPKKNRGVISDRAKVALFKLVNEQGKPVREAAELLNIKYGSAMQLIRRSKKNQVIIKM
ncbi:hypothetical protein K502DRAFT_324267 [Neoconidiobolus thromboides FSU 785]|nr:hypothetical protein K502DRAFT_324267 [Neoconidiobolus thromboides FSU 785]